MPLNETAELIKEENLRETFGEVFDHRAVSALHFLANSGHIDFLEHVISTGKEAHVFKAVDKSGNARAVKIYRIDTGYFRKMQPYIEGDIRFKKMGNGRQEIIYQWTRKEFKNLEKFYSAGVKVPAPFAFNKNVLVMEFVGKEKAAMPLKEHPIQDTRFLYNEIIKETAKMVFKAKLVHADLSEYNILNFEGKPVIIDCGQAVLLSHPKAMEFFERDLQNLSKYLNKLGLNKTPEEIKKEIKALENQNKMNANP